MRLDEKTMQKPLTVAALAVFANLLWGSAAPIIKLCYGFFDIAANDVPSIILFAGIRFTGAGVLTVLLASLMTGHWVLPKKSSPPKLLVLALLQTVIQYIFFYIGCANASGVKVSIVLATNAFLGILISSLLFRLEKLTKQKIIGCIVGFAGVVLVNLSPGGFDLQMSLKGEGFILISTTAYAFSYVVTKIYSREEDPVMLSGWQFIIGGSVMVIVSLLLGGRLESAGTLGLALLLYLMLLSAVAFSIWSLLMKYNPVSKVSVFVFMNPVFGVLLSTLLLKESAFGLRGVAALALVCLGIFIVNHSRQKKEN